jgi:putative transposase
MMSDHEADPLDSETPQWGTEAAPPLLSTLSEMARQQAMARFQIIQPCVERGVPLPEVARSHGVALRTARRWVQRYRAGGLVALSRPRGASRGLPRRVPPDMTQRIEALALQTPPLSVAAIHRQVVTLAALAAAHGTPAPCYRTVYNIIRRIAPALRTLAHAGSRAYHETFDLLYRREADAPNAIWQADHTLLDMLLTDEQGQAKKPWLTVILDDYSRAVAGYMVAFEAPSALHTQWL